MRDVLNNLRDRIEQKRAPARVKADSAEQALRGLAAASATTGGAQDAANLERGAAESRPRRRSRAPRASRLLAGAISSASRGLAAAEQAAVRAHLAPQALRDLALLKPSLLAEISKG